MEQPSLSAINSRILVPVKELGWLSCAAVNRAFHETKKHVSCRSYISLKEYFAYPTCLQEEILFAVAHSNAYKHFRDSDQEDIVRKFNELSKFNQKSLNCASWTEYKKMTLSDQEQIRLAIAKNENLVNKTPCLRPLGWEFSHYCSFEYATNHHIQTLLELHATLKADEKTICTPSKLKSLTIKSLEDLLGIIKKHCPNAGLFKNLYKIDIYKIFTTKHPLEKKLIFSALASLCNNLPKSIKAKLLALSTEEYNVMAFYAKIETKISDTTSKLKVVKKRISQLSSNQYTSLKHQINEKLETANQEYDSYIAVLTSMKEANAPAHTISKMEALLKSSEIPLLQKKIKILDKKHIWTSTKLECLQKLKTKYMHKITGLKELLANIIKS